MRQIILTLLFFSFSAIAFSQKNGTIKGIAFDTIANQAVSSATITLMQKKDSALVSFTMTDNAGRFELTGVPNGEYRLLITHVNYHNMHQNVTIDDEHKQADL